MKSNSDVKTRSYTLRVRSQRNRQLRLKMLRAAESLLRHSGVASVTIDAVAIKAKVGRTTVFENFKNKIGLLLALLEDVGERAGAAALLTKLEATEGIGCVVVTMTDGMRIWAKERDIFLRVAAASLDHAEAREALRLKNEQRAGAVAFLVDKLEAARILNPTFSRQQHIESFLALTSFDVFNGLFLAHDGNLEAVSRALLRWVSTNLTPPAIAKMQSDGLL